MGVIFVLLHKKIGSEKKKDFIYNTMWKLYLFLDLNPSGKYYHNPYF